MSEDIKREIARLEGMIASLEERYGTGVRPGWVGEDIAIYQSRIQRLASLLPKD